MSMTIADAQREMREAYLGNAPGLLVSACIWCAAGVAALFDDEPQRAVWTLLGGGMLIFPLGSLLTRALGRPGRHARGNPCGTLALETTVWMLLGLVLAYGVMLLRVDLFFPAALLVVGGRHLTFATIYGTRLYWGCGAAMIGAGFLAVKTGAPFAAGGFAGAAIESAFACLLFVRMTRRPVAAGTG